MQSRRTNNCRSDLFSEKQIPKKIESLINLRFGKHNRSKILNTSARM